MSFKQHIRTWIVVVILALSATGVPVSQAAPCKNETQLHIRHGRLLVNDHVALWSVSMMQSCFGYVYLYLPSQGLFVISDKPFDGASQTGTFSGRKLEWTSGKVNVKILSTSRILETTNTSAWVKVDPEFKVEGLTKVVIGTGEDPMTPYEWTSDVAENW